MRNIERTIDEVRGLRGDLSTWLVHLTKTNFFIDQTTGLRTPYLGKACLENILSQNVLNAVNPVGQFNYPAWYKNVNANDLKAISFTETPISEIYLFIGIKNKPLKFSPYGLVFDREELTKSPHFTAPVLYFSQPDGNRHFLNQFNRLEQVHYAAFKDVLYLFDKFGKTQADKDYNFMWEREWRHKGDLANVRNLVKFGLCPEHDIAHFENLYPAIPFIDPFFDSRQIVAKLKSRGIRI